MDVMLFGLPAAAFSSEGAKIAGRPDVAWS
jgi:hypothetical protein